MPKETCWDMLSGRLSCPSHSMLNAPCLMPSCPSPQNRHPQVRSAREEGALRIRTLEEGLARLSAAQRGPAGELTVEGARLVSELEAARRGEARAAADVAHLQVEEGGGQRRWAGLD